MEDTLKETHQQSNTVASNALDPQDLAELPYFENFLKRIGFKRIDGSIYGLLVMSPHPLSSEEIEKSLNLSQSAVCLSLKTLTHYGAVEISDDPENKRTKLHSAKDDSLSIVANVFRKRESEYVEEFKFMANRLYANVERQKRNTKLTTKTKQNLEKKERRLHSIIMTCETSETVMNFVMNLTRHINKNHYEAVLTRLPSLLNPLISSADSLEEISSIKNSFNKTYKRFKQSIGNPE